MYTEVKILEEGGDLQFLSAATGHKVAAQRHQGQQQAHVALRAPSFSLIGEGLPEGKAA